VFSVKCDLNINMIGRFGFSCRGLKTAANTAAVTNLIELNAWEADGCWGSQKITCCLWNWDVDMSPLLGPFLNQINPLHTSLPCTFNIHFSNILTLSTACNICNCVSLGVYSVGSVRWVMTSSCQPSRPHSMYSFMSYDSHMCTVQLRVTAVRIVKVHQATEV